MRHAEGVEQEAYDYILKTGRADVFFTGVIWGDEPDAFPQLEQFAKLFADTPYGEYANLTLAGIHVARKQFHEARGYLQSLASNSQFPLRDRVAKLLEQIRTN